MNDLNLSMFRAYDIRTPSELLTDDLSARLARAEAAYFRDDLGVTGVVAAHDARSSGPRYLEIAVREYTRAGLNVLVVPGVCSTSMFYFAAMRHPDLAAVMFGASHNPAGDTGRKTLGPGVHPIAEHIGPLGGLDRIKELYIRDDDGRWTMDDAINLSSIVHRPSSIGRITGYDPTGEYIRYSMNLAGVEPGGLAGLPVLHDYLNGAAGREMLLAFSLAGADLTPLHFTADGRFPLGDPNPVKQSVIREGLEVLTSGDFTLGTFFDGDGDRVDFYRGNGDYLASSFVYAGILPYIRQRYPAEGLGVFTDLKSNPLAIMEMAKAGFSVNVIRNGHSQIKSSMIDDATKVGAVEESAHFYEAFPAPTMELETLTMDDGRWTMEATDPQASGKSEDRQSSIVHRPSSSADQSSSIVHRPSSTIRYCTENTLYIALLVARAWKENPARFGELFDIQSRTSREREWGYKFPTDYLRSDALAAVQSHFESQGATAISRMANGYDLEATMMRRGVPFDITAETLMTSDWLQVCQRVSQSENGLARWEAVGSSTEIVSGAKRDIAGIVQEYGAGEEYQG